MSKDIRRYSAIKDWFKEAEDLNLTAVVGGEEFGSSIQFTIGHNFIVLSEKQLLDLISTIAKRIGCVSGFTATGYTELKTVLADGKIIIENEEEGGKAKKLSSSGNSDTTKSENKHAESCDCDECELNYQSEMNKLNKDE